MKSGVVAMLKIGIHCKISNFTIYSSFFFSGGLLEFGSSALHTGLWCYAVRQLRF